MRGQYGRQASVTQTRPTERKQTQLMQLGFVSAILPECTLEEVLDVAQDVGYDCVELMCWPAGKATRRYAGVTHVDVQHFMEDDVRRVHDLAQKAEIRIGALGYYPNPLCADREEAAVYIRQIKAMIKAAAQLGLDTVNTFIGRDPSRTVDAIWPRFLEVWRPLIRFAEDHNVRVGIENCPMYFTHDEWPSGKNLAHTPTIWRRMFSDIDSAHFGLNYDPSHMIWQHMDYLGPIREFSEKLFHVHAKDARLDQDRLNEVGIMATPNEFHTPKLPGLGDVHWGRFFSVLTDVGYQGPVCIEVEDRAYEGSLAGRKAALRQGANYLRQYIPKG